MDFWFVNIKYSEPRAVLAITICDLAVKSLRRRNIRPQHVSSRWFHLQYIWLTCCSCVHFFISCFSLHSSSEKSLPWRTAGMTTQSKQWKAIVLPSTSSVFFHLQRLCLQIVLGVVCIESVWGIEANIIPVPICIWSQLSNNYCRTINCTFFLWLHKAYGSI